jgi:outer membrane protein OmpU
MKKVLFATTALVATAGVASAEVAVTGWAEMGLFGGDNAMGMGIETQFFTDIDVLFRMSGETDNGLTFGAGVDLDENGAFTVNDDGGAFVFLSGNFGTVTMGDTDGALDWALTEAWVGNAGSIADDETAHAGALGSYGDGAYDGQILRYDNTFGDFGVAVSVEMDDDLSPASGTPGDGITRDTGFAIGFRYGMDMGGADLNVGVGYQFIDVANYLPGNLSSTMIPAQDFDGNYDIFGISATVASNGFSAGIEYTDFSANNAAEEEATHIGIGAGYTSGAFTISANYGIWDYSSDVAMWNGDITGFGLAAAYDLGGGASINAGYGVSDYSDIPALAATSSMETFSLGVAMSF